MEYADYHVVYVDNRISRDLDGNSIQRPQAYTTQAPNSQTETPWNDHSADTLKSILGEIEEVRDNLRTLLSVFNGVHVCTSGESCMSRVTQLDSLDADIQPVLVMLGTPNEDDVKVEDRSRPLSTKDGFSGEEFYGLDLLRHISSELQDSALSKLVVPISMVHRTKLDRNPISPSNRLSDLLSSTSTAVRQRSSSPQRSDPQGSVSGLDWTFRCVDTGAVDVLSSPLQVDRVRDLMVHGYRAHKETMNERARFLAMKKARKQSWLGPTDNRKYSYMRETMVSTLMKGICNPNEAMQLIDLTRLPSPDSSRRSIIAKAIGTWGFSGHDFSEDELVYAACLMLQHALSVPELEKWRLSPVELKTFLMASRAAYNDFVNYHNFRHVIDVMQAIFYFLLQLGTLPAYSTSSPDASRRNHKSPIAALLTPFDALTLLITAIGHDVGHPGVNNAFLVSLNAPLAQLYNDKSVLEAFHCAAYSQILRRYWKVAFEDTSMRALMIDSILATDMGRHFQYMKELGFLQEKVHHNGGTDGWDAKLLSEYRILTCALLVKCADISNVARPFDVAEKWSHILQLEFATQGHMEKDVGIPTTLFGGPPELDNIVMLGESQCNFMNMFARPLFEGVSDILPTMVFAVEEMKKNREIWSEKIKYEVAKRNIRDMKRPSEGTLSPKSESPERNASQPQSSHPEGLPASSPIGQSLHAQLTQVSQAVQASDNSRRRSASSIPNRLGSLDGSPQSLNGSRRSSLAHPFSSDSSRRPSAASPAGLNDSYSPATARKTNNSSPTQLQLGSTFDPRSQTLGSSATTCSENKNPSTRISEDTLSQSNFPGHLMMSRSQSGSREFGGAGEGRRPSKSQDIEDRNAIRFANNGSSNRPFTHMVHHRSSSGAHTNNTSVSQSTPYSPTGTQATSVRTIDSDSEMSPDPSDSWKSTDRKGMPAVMSVERPDSGQRHRGSNGYVGVKDVEIQTSVSTNGTMRGESHHQTLGRKGSRFNFNFWKKRKSAEASP